MLTIGFVQARGVPAAQPMIPLEPAPSDLAAGSYPRVTGVVQHGAARGRTLGFPTANLTAPRAALPEPGVYGGWVRIDDERPLWPAMIYVGSAPTFGDGEWRLEAHLLDFDGDLYGRQLAVRVVVRIDAECAHTSAGDLAQRLGRLAARTRAALGVPPTRDGIDGDAKVTQASEKS